MPSMKQKAYCLSLVNMNPKKKQELVDRVIKKYKLYTRDMIDFYRPTPETQSLSTSTNQSADDYYGSRTIEENVKIKPNIYYYMDAVERKVLKKIMEKKPGYEKYKLH